MFFDFNEDLIDLSDRPLMEKPLTDRPLTDRPLTDRPLTDRPLTRSAVNLNGFKFNNKFKFSSNNPFLNHFNGFKDAARGVDHLSPFASPVGSPLNYSPRVWSQSVHSSKPQSLSNCLFFDDNSNDSKTEFESNGREVPIDRSNNALNQTSGHHFIQYQLFGGKGFTYAQFKPIGKFEDSFRSKAKRKQKTVTFCTFCKNNNETPDWYSGHVVKDPFGRTTCPVLRRLNCPKCKSGGGDTGHTLRYCPMNKPDAKDHIPSVIKLLKSCRSADGKIHTF